MCCFFQVSEFTANATIKGASIAVDCQHSSSNHSMSGMCIVFTGDYNGTCSLKTCTEVQRMCFLLYNNVLQTTKQWM